MHYIKCSKQSKNFDKIITIKLLAATGFLFKPFSMDRMMTK